MALTSASTDSRALRLDRQEWIQKLEAVVAMAPERSRAVRFEVGDALSMQTSDPSRGEAQESMELIDQQKVEDGFVWGMNGRHLLDLLQVLPSEEVSVGVPTDAVGAFSFASFEDTTQMGVIMAMRL